MDPFTLVIIAAVVGVHTLGKATTDAAYAIRGKDSPRWEARKAAIKAAVKTGRPVRYGFGGYVADLIDDGFKTATARREARQTGELPGKDKPMRSYLGRVWGHRWDNAAIKHDRKHRDRQVKKGLIDPDAPADGGLDDAFDSVSQPVPAKPAQPSPRTADELDDEPIDVIHDADTGEPDARPPLPPVVSPEDVGISPLTNRAEVIAYAKALSGEERERVLRNYADEVALRELEKRALASSIGQHMARHYYLVDPDDWQPQMRMLLRGEARNERDRAERTEQHHKALVNELNTNLEEDTTITDPNPAEAVPPGPAVPTSNVVSLKEFINRKDNNDMTTIANAEAVGLDDAITYAEQSVKHHTDTAPALELFKVGLAQGGCGDGTLSIVDEIEDANTVIEGLYQRLHDSLVQDKVTVGDAYNARPDAGTKEFVTN
ncbi:MAG: hypothetical protein ACRD0P_15740 [Stackebrandtia sp.]